MEVGVAKKLLNVAEYYKMAEIGILKPTDHVELVQGEIYEMSPIGSKHAGIVKRLAVLFARLFGDMVTIGIQDPIRLSKNSEPEPDISILKHRDDYYTNAHPCADDVLAIIEVSDSSIKYDREVKAPLYASFGIPTYWMIDIENREVVIMSNPMGGMYIDKSVYKKGEEGLLLLGKSLSFNEILA